MKLDDILKPKPSQQIQFELDQLSLIERFYVIIHYRLTEFLKDKTYTLVNAKFIEGEIQKIISEYHEFDTMECIFENDVNAAGNLVIVMFFRENLGDYHTLHIFVK